MIESLRNAKKNCQRIQERYWPNEVKQDLKMAPPRSAEKWIDVLSKGGGQKKRFQYCLKPNCPGRLLYVRAIQGHSGKAHSRNAPLDLVLQDNVLLPMNFTRYVYHVGHGNELRSIVRIGLIPGGFRTDTGRYAVFFTVVDPMDDKRGLRETFAIYQKQESRLTRILGNHFKTRCIGAIYCSLKKEDCDFTKQGPMQLYSMTHCLYSMTHCCRVH